MNQLDLQKNGKNNADYHVSLDEYFSTLKEGDWVKKVTTG